MQTRRTHAGLVTFRWLLYAVEIIVMTNSTIHGVTIVRLMEMTGKENSREQNAPGCFFMLIVGATR